MTILYVLLALLLLGILIIVHEGGHFLGARLTGIPVREFSIGFGPKLLERKSRKHDTNFVLRAIPAGGYCAFYGEDDPNAEEKDDERSMTRFPVWKRIVTVFMGPGMNFILALIVAFGYFVVMGEATGVEYGRPVITEVTEDGPAREAGMLGGDIITEVNGKSAGGLDENGNTILSGILSVWQEGDSPIAVTVERGGAQETLTVTPRWSDDLKGMAIGIIYQMEAWYTFSPVGPGRALQLSAGYCVEAGGAILGSLKRLVTTGEGIEDTGGPIRIIQVVTEETPENGFWAYISLLILISVNLGLMNLLPIPGLDGSRILFLAVEGVLRRPVNRKVETYIHLSGYVLLIGLFAVLTYRDILNLF